MPPSGKMCIRDSLYYFDGAELIPAVLEKEGETECSIYDQEGRLLGVDVYKRQLSS